MIATIAIITVRFYLYVRYTCTTSLIPCIYHFMSKAVQLFEYYTKGLLNVIMTITLKLEHNKLLK